jgi:hypothetical protein
MPTLFGIFKQFSQFPIFGFPVNSASGDAVTPPPVTDGAYFAPSYFGGRYFGRRYFG